MKQRILTICISAIVLLLITASACRAQFNDSVHYFVGVAATGSFNNTDKGQAYLLNNGIKLGLKKKYFDLNSANTWVYGSQQNLLTNNDYNSSLDFHLYKSIPHSYFWGLGTYTSSYSLKINVQYQGGAGVAYKVWDRKNIVVNISDGILYESSNITVDTTINVYSTFRNSLRLQLRWDIAKIITIKGTSYYQNSLSDGNDYIIKANIEFALKIKKWLSLTTSYAYNSFNLTHKENSLLNYGLTFEKYF